MLSPIIPKAPIQVIRCTTAEILFIFPSLSNISPKQFTLNILPVSRSWSEGTGLDMESYADVGFAKQVYLGSGLGNLQGSANIAGFEVYVGCAFGFLGSGIPL